MFKLARRSLLLKEALIKGGGGARMSSSDIKSKKIGLIGMGNVGDAVYYNLTRSGFNVVSVTDVVKGKCSSYATNTIKVRDTNREVAQDADIVITSENNYLLNFQN